MAEAYQLLNDNPGRINAAAKATRIEGDAHVPSNGSVIRARGDLSDIRVERDVQLGVDGAVVGSVEMFSLSEVVKPDKAIKVAHGELHEDASLSIGVEPQGVPAVTQRQTTEAVLADVSGAVTEEVAEEAEEEMSEAANSPFTRERIRITLESARMGKHRVSVNKFAVSDSVVILGYIDDDEAVIVEPPMAENQEDKITVSTRNGESYKCLSYGFTAEARIDGHPMLLVVLVRLPE